MTEAEFIADARPDGLYPGESVIPCCCDSSDCQGWKIFNREQALREMEAMDRLPDVLISAARKAGEELGWRRELAALRALRG